jgi:hypothetical protein
MKDDFLLKKRCLKSVHDLQLKDTQVFPSNVPHKVFSLLRPREYNELIKTTFIWNIFQCCGYLPKHKGTDSDSLQYERFASATNDQYQRDMQNPKEHIWKISLVN